jgi:hypothetical protein
MFIADIDEASPSEDEEAAQRALHGENGAEGGDVHPEGHGSVSNLLLIKKLNSCSLQIIQNMLNQVMQEMSFMIIAQEIGPTMHQINNNFSMQQDASFGALETLMFLTLTVTLTTMKMRRKVHNECMPVDISEMILAQGPQDTILNAGEKPLIGPKNSFGVLLCYTISFQVAMPIFKTQQGFSQRS